MITKQKKEWIINGIDILDIIYPIGHMYIITSQDGLTNFNKIKSLKSEWTWEIVSNNNYLRFTTNTSVIGTAGGSNTLVAQNLPAHAHAGIFYNNSRQPTGTGDANHCVADMNPGSEQNKSNNSYIMNSIGLLNGNSYTSYANNQMPFYPTYYYICAYVRTS